jgi:8-oxo-dGTP pyrophosphatase MutT (NUDIX family)
MNISFKVEKNLFNYRIAGLVVREDGKFLIQTATAVDFYTLPGGRIEMLENSREALRRELMEELEIDTEIGEMFLFLENFFDYDGLEFHELNQFYTTKILGGKKIQNLEDFEDAEGKGITSSWVTKEEIKDMDLRPYYLKDIIINSDMKNIPFNHIIGDEHRK